MTQDEIIEMANKAGFDLTMWQLSLGCEVSGTHNELLAFAKLVAEAEREACAKHLDDQNTGMTDLLAAEIRARGQA